LSHHRLEENYYCTLSRFQVFGSNVLKTIETELAKQAAGEELEAPEPTVGEVLDQLAAQQAEMESPQKEQVLSETAETLPSADKSLRIVRVVNGSAASGTDTPMAVEETLGSAYAWISSAKMPSIGGNGDDLSTVLKSISQSLEEDLHTGYKAIDSAAMALTQRDDKNTANLTSLANLTWSIASFAEDVKSKPNKSTANPPLFRILDQLKLHDERYTQLHQQLLKVAYAHEEQRQLLKRTEASTVLLFRLLAEAVQKNQLQAGDNGYLRSAERVALYVLVAVAIGAGLWQNVPSPASSPRGPWRNWRPTFSKQDSTRSETRQSVSNVERHVHAPLHLQSYQFCNGHKLS
jgi:hypothetical protein